MKKLIIISICVVLLSFAIGCQPKIDVEKEKTEIFKTYSLQIQALLKSDVDTFLSLIPEGHERINVNWGKIIKMSKADTKLDLENQFKQGRYIEVNETVAPTITISPDGKMAWAVGQMQFKYAYQDSKGAKKENSVTNAWLAVYTKVNSKWVETAIAQTFDKAE